MSSPKIALGFLASVLLSLGLLAGLQNTFSLRNVNVVAWDYTPGAPPPVGQEFDISGATYFAVAPSGYSYSSEQTTNYSTRKYETLAAAEGSLNASPSTPQVINILGSWSANDGPVVFDGVSTSAANFILVRTIGDARHNGIPHLSSGASSTAHRVVRSSGTGHVTQISDPYVTFEGLQIIMGTGSVGGASDEGCRVEASNATFDKCLIASYSGVSSQDGIHVPPGTFNNLSVINCLVIGWARAGITIQFWSTGSSSGNYFANNTVAKNNVVDGSDTYGGGINLYGANGTITAKLYNNLVVMNAISDFRRYNTVTDSGSHNASTFAPYGGWSLTDHQSSIGSTQIDIADEANRDYHLTATSEIIGDGTDLSADPDHPFSDDIDGETRSSWDIGFDEYTP